MTLVLRGEDVTGVGVGYTPESSDALTVKGVATANRVALLLISGSGRTHSYEGVVHADSIVGKLNGRAGVTFHRAPETEVR